jgi:hypothetical protein
MCGTVAAGDFDVARVADHKRAAFAGRIWITQTRP